MIICLSVSGAEGVKNEITEVFLSLMSFTQYSGLLNAYYLTRKCWNVLIGIRVR
jgi:hypothetical protein